MLAGYDIMYCIFYMFDTHVKYINKEKLNPNGKDKNDIASGMITEFELLISLKPHTSTQYRSGSFDVRKMAH